MDVQTQVVARPVHHPPPVELAVGGERLLDGPGQQPPVAEASRDDLHGCPVHVAEPRTRSGDRERGVGGVEDRLVHPALDLGERSVDRERPGDVGGVERLHLHARVEQDEVAGTHRSVVADPVQGRGVGTGSGDRLVADGVSLLASVPVEAGLDDPFPACVPGGARQVADDPLEPRRGGSHGAPHLVDLVVVLHQPQLAQRLGQLVIAGAAGFALVGALTHPVDSSRAGRVRTRDDAKAHAVGADVLGECLGKLVQGGGPDTGERGEVVERGARPHPELAVPRVGEELLRGAAGERAEVEHGLVTAVDGVQHEHRVRLVVGAQSGEVGERRVRTEPVVGVVRPGGQGPGGHH